MYDPIELPDETLELQQLVRRICDDHQMPLERRILDGEELTFADFAPGRDAARAAGLWGLGMPAEHGGAELSPLNLVAISEEAARPLAQLRFGGDIPMALLTGSPAQRARYTEPLLEGTLRYCFAQTEPGGGGDPGGATRTRAVRDGDSWVINGNKVWISGVADADVVFVVAVTDGELRQRGGISMFAVDIDNPGLVVAREIEVLGGMKIHELFFDNCRVDAEALLGDEGAGFKHAQQLLSNARMTVAGTALGIATRALEMMIDHAQQRETFGSPLSHKQAVQAFVVDSWMEIHQARLALYNAARLAGRGQDTRVVAGMVKVVGTETVGRVLDRAIQVHGAAGAALDNPLAHWYGLQRMSRIYEGPTEVHKYQSIARTLLGPDAVGTSSAPRKETSTHA